MNKDSEYSHKENRHHVRFWKLAGLILLFVLLGFTLTAFTCIEPQLLDSISFNQDGSPSPPDTEAETPTPEPPEAPKPAAIAAAELSITKSVEPDEGEHFDFKIVIENTGDAQALNIIVSDQYPDVLTIDKDNVTSTAGTVSVIENQVIVNDHANKSIFEEILIELKKINLHLESMTDEQINEDDINGIN